MQYFTRKQIKDRVRNGLDLIDEDFITDAALNDFVNEAIDQAEAEIHTIYEDYFLTRKKIRFVVNKNLYLLPPNIYANKIRRFQFRVGSTRYDINKLKEIRHTLFIEPDEDYRYKIVNDNFAISGLPTIGSPIITDVSDTDNLDIGAQVNGVGIPTDSLITAITDSPNTITISANATAGGATTTLNIGGDYQIKIYPPSRENTFGRGEEGVTLWYLRNARRLELDTDECDIPEFIPYIVQYAKMRCYEFEGHPNTVKAVADSDRYKKLMVETLTQMIPDDDSRIPMDFEFYWDFDYDPFFF